MPVDRRTGWSVSTSASKICWWWPPLMVARWTGSPPRNRWWPPKPSCGRYSAAPPGQHGPYDPDAQVRREPSKRWRRSQAHIARVHARVANIRAHEIHIATTTLATQHESVVVEQLNAKGMGRRGGRRKRGLNRALGDAALGRIRTQLDYKTT
jgi:hypothetical protein